MKFRPVMITLVPTRPAVGEKPVMMAGAKKFVVVLNEPLALTTVIGPVATFAGAFTSNCVSPRTPRLVPFVPLNFTAVAPVKWAPFTVTVVFCAPAVGEKLETYG